MTRDRYRIVARALAWACVFALLVTACSNSESRDDAGVFRRTKRLRQAKFKPDDFTFVKLQIQDGEEHGLFGTCIHVPMFDQHQRTWDCDIGINLPIHVRGETWPRSEDDAARYVARAFNALRKDLETFVHADAFTCRAYYNRIGSYLRNGTKGQRETWAGAGTMKCPIYQGTPLPDFYFRGGQLLIGDYREWGKYIPTQ